VPWRQYVRYYVYDKVLLQCALHLKFIGKYINFRGKISF